MNKILIAPSILAANPEKYGDECRKVSAAGADWVHVDIMDGSFVPPITFGANIIKTAKKSSGLFTDCHLMTLHPETHLESFISAGADMITVHQEVCPHLHRTLQEIKTLGAKSGVALNPGTPVETIFEVLPLCDLVLIMTVNPGWGGQKFIAECFPKITKLRSFAEKQNLSPWIQVDGGINQNTAKQVISAGADVLVAGTYFFKSENQRESVELLRGEK